MIFGNDKANIAHVLITIIISIFSCWIRRYRGGIEERSGRWCGQDIYIRKQLAWMELYNRRSRKQAA